MALTESAVSATQLPDKGVPVDEGMAQEASVLSLNRLLRVIQRRRRPFLVAGLAVGLFSFSKTTLQVFFEPTYAGSFTLMISNPVTSQTSGGQGQQGGGEIESLARNNVSNDVPTLIQVLGSNLVMEPVYNQLVREGYKNFPSPEIKLLQSGPGGPTTLLAAGVLQITGSGKDQKSLQRMLELTEKAYINWSTTQRRLQLTEGVRFLDQQEPLLQARNLRIQEELKRFRTKNNVLSPEAAASGLNLQMASVNDNILQLIANRKELLDIKREVQQGRLTARSFSLGSGSPGATSGGGADVASAASSSLAAGLPSQGLLDQWQTLEGSIAAARIQYTSNSPVLRGLISTQKRLLPVLLSKQQEAIDAALRQNADILVSTRQKLLMLQKSFKIQPQLMSEFESLQQRIEIATTNLNNYLKTRDQFQLEIAQNTSPWEVISPAIVNRSATAAGLSKGLIQSLLLGLGAGVAAAVLKDRLDHVFHSPDEVERELKQPLLGHMPYVAAFEGVRQDKRIALDLNAMEDSQDKVGQYQRFYYQEALRNLYTSIRFLETGSPLQSICITSSRPSEGKSMVTLLFAKTVVELGKKVLLVDADLRKPQLHFRAGIDNLRGLTNLLTEPELNWRDLVQDVPGIPRMQLITAGRTTPNPPRLLGSSAMTNLVNDIETSGDYDMVIYDAPPVLGLADSALLAGQLDGLVLLVGLNNVDRAMPVQAVKRLKDSNARLLGIVTNARRPKGEKAGAYAYGYGKAQGSPYEYSGYGALDPAAAYSYYEGNWEGTTEGKRNTPEALSVWKRFKSQIQSEALVARWNQIKRWLDNG